MTDSGSNPESDRTIPLGVGDLIDETALDPLANITERKKFNAGSLVLVLVVTVACGGLWFMRSLSKVGAATQAPTDIEASIEQFINKLKGNETLAPDKPASALVQADAGVLAVLSGSYTERQVPLENVQRNPFIIYGESPVALTSMDDGGDTDVTRRRAQRQEQYEKAVSRLELKSVLMSSQPLANISGKIVRKGDEYVAQPDNIVFRVDDISKDSVTLVGEDAALNIRVPVTLLLRRDR